MSLLSPELIAEAAPQVRTFLRKVALTDTEHWLRGNLPRVNSVPGADVLARQVVELREALRQYLAGQEARFIAYVREHPPEMRPVDAGALAALPPEAVLTYHVWLQDLIQATEERDKEELARLVRAHLQECIGTGAMAARRQMGTPTPGFGRLTQKEALALLRRMPANSIDPSEQAFHRAIADRAHRRDLQGAVMRDGGGRPVAATTYTTRGKTLAVRNLGSLERAVPGAGLHLLRELAGLAASKQQGLTITAPAEGSRALRALGFLEETGGRFTISANSALALAQSAPGPSAAWTRAGLLEGPAATSDEQTVAKAEETPLPEWARRGWLEGPARTFSEVTGDVTALEAELAATWPTATANFGQAQAAIANFRSLAQNVAAGNITAEEAAAMHLYVLRGKDGYVDAVALVREVAGQALYGERFGARVGRTGAGREMMRRLCGLESARNHGFRLNSTGAAEGFYERLGMTQLSPAQGWTGAEYFFAPQQAQAFASGLTRGMTFTGQIAWELAVDGAQEYLENIIIPGVVDTVSATTHRQLVDALIEGLARGEGTNDLIARIRALDEKTFGLVRAERIARTEAITANRAGGYQMAVASGSAEKRWVSRLMPNTRDWHREAHGQVVPIAKPFVVANRKGVPEHLMFPGDRSLGAGPENVIQCVCVPLYLSPGVSDDTTFARYGASRSVGDPGPVIALVPEPVRKADVISLEELREFVAKDKGWVPGPNAGWKRRDEAPSLHYVIADTEKAKGGFKDASDLADPERVKRVWMQPGAYLRLCETFQGPIISADRPTIDALRQRIRDGQPLTVPWIQLNPDGVFFAQDGRHRSFAAAEEGIGLIPVDMILLGSSWDDQHGLLDRVGVETAPPPARVVQKDKGWMPGPNAGWKRKDEGPAAAKMPEVGEGFNAWRDRLWEGVKRGNYFKDEPALYRAMSSGEFDAAMEAGEFRPLTGQDLYVTPDPDRLAGGAYGGRDGGYIVQFAPSLETRTAGSQTVASLEETVVDSAAVDDVVAVYRWDPEKRDHVRIPWNDQVQKDKGWAPGPNAQWRRLDDVPGESRGRTDATRLPGIATEPATKPDDEKRLNEIETDTQARLARWEIERARSTNRYRNYDPEKLQWVHGNLSRKVEQLREWKQTADLTAGTWSEAEEAELVKFQDRLDEVRAENVDRRAYYDLKRQLKAIDLGRQYGVPVLDRTDVEAMLSKTGDAYRDAGVLGQGYTPEAFRMSDLSGQLVRWYVTLPDGRIAHPDEIHEAKRRKRLVVIDSIVPEPRDWTKD